MAASTLNGDPGNAPGMVRGLVLAVGAALPVWLAVGAATWALLR